MEFVPCLVRSVVRGEVREIRLGHRLLDEYLAFVAARARTNTWLATAYDLRVFFSVVGKEPGAVTRTDVFAFLAKQRAPRRGETVVRLDNGEQGLTARTIARRLSSVSGCSPTWSPVRTAGSAPTRCPVGWPPGAPLAAAAVASRWSAPRAPCRASSLRPRWTRCWRRCAPDGTGRWCWRCCWAGCAAARCSGCGWPTSMPASGGCSSPRARAGGSASCRSRPVLRRPGGLSGPGTTDECGHREGVRRAQGATAGPAAVGGRAEQDPRRGPSRCRADPADLPHAAPYLLHPAAGGGHGLEAIQAQAGHASIETTRIYLHLANGWLAEEYRRVSEAIDAQANPMQPVITE